MMVQAPKNPRFPYDDTFGIGGENLPPERIFALLEDRLTERRQERIERVVAERTFELACVFDGPYDLGNVSAVLRTCEGLGIQPIHLIETQESFKAANRVTQGAEKWLDVSRWSEPTACMRRLKDQGYRILATHLEAARPIAEFDFTEPTALVMGNERDGVSDEVLEACDARCFIPMAGFTQSFNISVAAALALYHARRWRTEHLGGADLSDAEQRILRAEFWIRAVDRAEEWIEALLERGG